MLKVVVTFYLRLAKGPLRGPITLLGFLKIEGSEVLAFLGKWGCTNIKWTPKVQTFRAQKIKWTSKA